MSFRLLVAVLLALWAGFTPPARAAESGMVTVGNARFTVVTPLCIRLEYSANGGFVDAPSLFAVNRQARFTGYRVRQAGGATTIDTGAIQLTYAPDGQPFSAANLKAYIRRGAGTALWTPGTPNGGNLGGTIRTLDGVSGPVDLGQGLLSRDGWYLLDDSRDQLYTADWVQSRPKEAGTDWYLFGYGLDYKAALKTLAVIGGPVPLPRKYALGAWYSRYWPYSSTEYRQIVQEYGQHDFPLDNMVMDMDWHRDGWTGWSWNRKLLPDAEALLQWFHGQGLHVTLNLHPADGVGPQEDQYAQFMRDMGADPATKQTLPFDAGDRKYMETLYADVHQPLLDEGVDFWWLDWQQGQYTRSIPDLTNLMWLNNYYYRHTSANGQRGMSFSRWAGWGDHRHPIHFSGDANTGFPMLAFEVPFTSTAGNVGCFFWSHDIGGHMGGRNEESYTRWIQFGATSPVLRSHSTRDAATDRRPWNYPKWAEDSMRVSFHLRSELFPYIYSSAWESTRETVPLDRPLYIEYPQIENAYHNAQQYFFGDNLLAAPIVTAGVGPGRVGHQTVWFPPGVWYNHFTGERYQGGTEALVSSDINEFPLYVRGGVPIPMQPYAPRMTSAPLAALRVRCYPGEDGQTGRFTLYEDDGVTTAHERGAFAVTPLTYARRGATATVTIGVTAGQYTGKLPLRACRIELPDTARARSAKLDGTSLPVVYDAATATNTISLPPLSTNRAVSVEVQAAPLTSSTLSERAQARRAAGVLGTAPGKSMRAMLADAISSHMDPKQIESLLAVAGVGMVHKNEGAYLYGGAMRDYFYAPAGLLDGDTVLLGPAKTPTRVRSGVALAASGAARSFRGHVVYGAAQAAFSIGGQQFHLPAIPSASDDLLSDANVALNAKLTPSGNEVGYGVAGATDGVLGGYPGDKSQEWSAGATVGATLRLDWDTEQTVDRVVLYDRPNLTDQITAGTLTFSDGSVLPVGELPNDGATGLEVRFPSKTIKWLIFKVTGVKPGTLSVGLSEIAVYRAK